LPTEPTHPTGQRARLAALVVTHNRIGQIRRTIGRLRETPVSRICVVDNNSCDGTREWLAGIDDPRLRLIRTECNLGGAGGFELGLRTLMAEDRPDWVVLMDDDSRPAPGAIEHFCAMTSRGWDAVAAAVYRPDGCICEINRPTRNPFWSARTFLRTSLGWLAGNARGGFHLPDRAYADRPQEIDATSFVGLFLPRATIERAGFPDGRLFIYGDDVLYTLGLRKRGLRIMFVPDLHFEHDHDAADQTAAGHYVPTWKAYYNARNGLLVTRSAAGALFWPAFVVVLLKWALAGRHYGTERGRYFRLVRQGVRDGLRGKHDRPHDEILALARDRA
jgi:GT2 family glycosyltransferase